jgi:hypothetical protein
MVEVKKFEVIELLQDHVAGVIENIGARVVMDSCQKLLKRDAVMEVFARVQFEADVYTCFVERIKDRKPALAQFLKCFIDHACGALGPRVKERPGECSGKCGVRREAKILAGLCCPLQLLNSPGLAGFRIACQCGRSKASEERVICGMAGDELTLQVR